MSFEGMLPGTDGALESELDPSVLVEGRAFPEVGFVLSDAVVDAYLDATGEAHALYRLGPGGGFAPALATTLVRLAKASLGGRWPSGTLQLGHWIAMRRALRRGETLTIDIVVSRVETQNGRIRFETTSTMRDAQRHVVGEQGSTQVWAGAVGVAPERAASSSPTSPSPWSSSPSTVASRSAAPALGPLETAFTARDVLAFGRVAGALDPIHVDPDFAKRTRYGTNIVQGRLAMAALARLMLDRFGREWLDANAMSVRFARPVLVGEPVRAWAAPIDGDDGACALWCDTPSAPRAIVGTARVGSAVPPTG